MKFNDYTEKNLLIVVSGPSGAGKSTVLQVLIRYPDVTGSLEFSVSATTRVPRPGEVHGEHYHFISHEEFEMRKARGLFLESELVHEEYYGTPESNLTEASSRGNDLLLEIDVKGAVQIKKKCPEAVLIFIVAPFDEIRRRLLERPHNLKGEELEREIDLRLKNAEQEIKNIPDYDYLLINENLDECVKLVISIIQAERCRIVVSQMLK